MTMNRRAMPRLDYRQMLGVTAGAATLLWGVWASHAILDLRRAGPHLVKVQLAELVREFVQTEARSGAPSDRITAETATFLKALGEAVNARAAHGETVLLANAVVGGDVPDITMAVRSEVYAHVPRPQAGAAEGLSPQMQQFFDAQGQNQGQSPNPGQGQTQNQGTAGGQSK